MKTDVQPDRLWTDLHPQPPQVALDHNLFMRLHNGFIVQPLHGFNLNFPFIVFVIRLRLFVRRIISNELDGHGLIQDADQQALHGAGQARLQPVARIRIARSDNQHILFKRNHVRIAHPGIEGGARHFQLKLA